MKNGIIYNKLHAILSKLANWYLLKYCIKPTLTEDTVTIAFNDTRIYLRFAEDAARRTFQYDLNGEFFVLIAGPIRDRMEAVDYYRDTANLQKTDLLNG